MGFEEAGIFSTGFAKIGSSPIKSPRRPELVSLQPELPALLASLGLNAPVVENQERPGAVLLGIFLPPLPPFLDRLGPRLRRALGLEPEILPGRVPEHPGRQRPDLEITLSSDIESLQESWDGEKDPVSNKSYG